jgi:hypothetical protein
MAAPDAKNLVFHYAPWARLPAIVEAGHLRCSNTGAPGEQPLLWFSAHQFWEPTATKVVHDGQGGFRAMTFEQQRDQFGCVRFGLSAQDPRLMSWPVACKFAGTGRDARRSLERAGRVRGANPSQWLACGASISLGELTFEVFGDGAWAIAVVEEMAQVWTRVRGGVPGNS